jgi:hypothetical protein
MRFSIPVFFLACAAFCCGADPCHAVHKVEQGDTLRELADFYFGDRHFDSALLLATNSRAGDGFPFIFDINDITKIEKVCVPEFTEAQRLRSRYDAYVKAIIDMALPEPWEKAGELVTFPPDKPITTTLWVRPDQIKMLQDASGAWTATAPYELWVTVEPNLQRFCANYAAGRGAHKAKLTLRLEQRLGLPPASNKTTFVRVRLAQPTPAVIFRPCMYPTTSEAHCPLGPPPQEVDDSHKNWLYRQYYSSYGQARVSSFPWTSLGYTFDWAPADNAEGDTEFQKYGESEFVIRKGAPIEILEAVDTLNYCK